MFKGMTIVRESFNKLLSYLRKQVHKNDSIKVIYDNYEFYKEK